MLTKCKPLTFLALAIGITLQACTTNAAVKTTKRKPNIILLFSDDAGYGDIGCFGSKEFPTPNIDKLAKSGVKINAGYVAASVCSPSRAGLLTGKYAQRFGYYANLPGTSKTHKPEERGLDTNQKTIADVLKAQGYKTAVFGKWHLGDAPKFRPNQRGFDEFYGFLGGSRSFFPIKKEIKYIGHQMRHQDVVQPESPEYMTDLLTDKANAFIEENKDNPFFIYLSYNAVHTPMHAKQQDIEKFKHIKPMIRRKLAAMTHSLDINIGRVIAKLESLNLTKDTLVIFLNDNGAATINGAQNGTLRGMKGDLFEGGTRVPFIISWPGTLKPEQEYNKPVISLDVLPTALAAAGGQADGDVDGVNLLPYLSGKNKNMPHEKLFWKRGGVSATQINGWKLICVENKPIHLFNIFADRDEKNNLIKSELKKIAYLHKELNQWESKLETPRWEEPPFWYKRSVDLHLKNQ